MKKYKARFNPKAKYADEKLPTVDIDFPYQYKDESKEALRLEALKFAYNDKLDVEKYKTPIITLIYDSEKEAKEKARQAEKEKAEQEKAEREKERLEKKEKAEQEKEEKEKKQNQMVQLKQQRNDETELQLLDLNKKLSTLEPGERIIIADLPDHIYHRCLGISCSQVKDYMRCPQYFLAKHVKKILHPEGKAYFDMGKAIHTLVLEPHMFDATYIQQPEDIKRRTGDKWTTAKLEAEAKGQVILTQEQWEHLSYFRTVKDSHAVLKKLTSNGIAEQSVFYKDIQTDLILKCRPDYQINKFGFDLKTAESADPEVFHRAAIRYGYNIQDAMYTYVADLLEFVFGVVENKMPFLITVPLKFSELAKKKAFIRFREAIVNMAESFKRDIWPSYYAGLYTMDLKAWEDDDYIEDTYYQLIEAAKKSIHD